jgi:ferredoxin-NADP reductase
MNAVLDWRNAQVVSVTDLTSDIRLFEIAPRGPFTPATPGSHIDVTVQINDRPATRSYSTLAPGERGTYRIAVKRMPDSRGGSNYMWSMKSGALLQVAPPKNHFALSHGCPDYLLIAGGIGITPIFSMAQALAARGAKFRVLYACRSKADAALASELADIAGELMELFLSAEGRRIDIAAEIGKLDANGECYVCGPLGMIEDARHLWAQSGRPAGNLRFETFGNTGHAPNTAFMVNLPLLARSIEVAKNQTLLEALEAADIDAMFDCRRGECGLCAVNVISVDGTIDHRDVFLSDEEKAEGHKICACVSRMTGGSITLDTGERPA